MKKNEKGPDRVGTAVCGLANYCDLSYTPRYWWATFTVEQPLSSRIFATGALLLLYQQRPYVARG